MSNNVFTKNMIIWQCTIVKFRNGYWGIAINDKNSNTDYDGDEVFMVFDPISHKFINVKRLCNYDENLRNTLSVIGIIDTIDNICSGQKFAKIPLNDSNWDVINVTPYVHSFDAFTALTSGVIPYWRFSINQN